MKSPDPAGDLSDFGILDLRKEGKGKDFPTTSLRLWKAPLPVIQFAVGILKMDGNGVVYEGLDPFAGQKALKGIALLCPYHEEMIDVAYPSPLDRRQNGNRPQGVDIHACFSPPLLIPRIKMSQFHPKHRGLDLIESAVVSLQRMPVSFF